MPEEKISVSVIVCAFNEEENIAGCIDSILKQEFSGFELIIIDDGSGDNTPAVIRGFNDPRIRYIRNEKNSGPAASRNIGISQAQGEYIFFTDADCLPLPHWIKAGVRCFEREDCIGVSGLTLPDKYYISASYRVVNSQNSRFQTCNIAYTRDGLIKAGGFDEYLRVGEDIDLGYRIDKLGKNIYNGDMIVLHKVEKFRYLSELKYMWECGKGMAYITKKHALNNKVIFPQQLAGLIFPPFLLIYYAFQSWPDLKILPLLYFRFIVLRLSIWAFAFKNKIFIV